MEGRGVVIAESFAAQLAELRAWLELAESEGSGVQITLSCNPGAKISEPRIAIFPKLTGATKQQ